MNGKKVEKLNILNFWHDPYGFDKPYIMLNIAEFNS